LKTAPLHWTSRQQKANEGVFGLPAVPYTGVPFAQVGVMGMECHMGRIRKFKPSVKKEKEEQDTDDEVPLCARLFV
jgi:hypothetical protein